MGFHKLQHLQSGCYCYICALRFMNSSGGCDSFINVAWLSIFILEASLLVEKTGYLCVLLLALGVLRISFGALSSKRYYQCAERCG